jgi:hypothetical protein
MTAEQAQSEFFQLSDESSEDEVEFEKSKSYSHREQPTLSPSKSMKDVNFVDMTKSAEYGFRPSTGLQRV